MFYASKAKQIQKPGDKWKVGICATFTDTLSKLMDFVAPLRLDPSLHPESNKDLNLAPHFTTMAGFDIYAEEGLLCLGR
jgi:hypothetical protein